MTTKIIRGDGVTELSGVKTCVYTERVNAETNLRPGCVAAASINVEVYGSQANAVNAGEALTYYQVDSNGNDTLIGVFYAEPSIPTRSTYKFVAYDAAAKLDCDFSERLYSISADFPMSVYDIVSEACAVAGVTLGSASWPLSTQTVEEFYSDGITCRQIVSWAAEIACCFVKCDTAGELTFGWYAAKSGYEIRPGSGSSAGVTYVPYKQDGLNYENYAVDAIQYVAVRPIDTEGVAYIYPNTFVDVTATDPNEDGNVALADITVTDTNNDGNVAITSFINITDDNGNLTITNGTGGGNTLVIYDNLLLCDATTATMTAVATNIYNRMTAVGQYRPMTAKLFPFDNPYRAGDIVNVQDIQGVAFSSVVMEMRVDLEAAKLSSTGNKEQDDVPVNTQSRITRLGENIIKLNKLKVGWAEIDTAIIHYLEADGISADYIRFDSYTGFEVPSEYDASTLFDNQTITNGWIVDSTAAGALVCRGDVSQIQGNDVTVSVVTPTFVSSGMLVYTTADGQMGSQTWTAPQYGDVDSDGVLDGATGQGSDYKYTRTFTIGNDWASILFFLTSNTTFKEAVAYVNTASALSWGYGSTVWMGAKGLQVGKFVVDKTGNVTSNGDFAAKSIKIGNNLVYPFAHKTVTYTTTSAGEANLNLSGDYGVVYVRRTDDTSICLPFYGNGSGSWWAKVTSVSGTAVTGTSVTLEVGYYDTTISP